MAFKFCVQDPRVAKLTSIIGGTDAQSFGIIAGMMVLAMRENHFGSIGNDSESEIAKQVNWPGDPMAMLPALVKAGVLEDRGADGYRFPDWIDRKDAEDTESRAVKITDGITADPRFLAAGVAGLLWIRAEAYVTRHREALNQLARAEGRAWPGAIPKRIIPRLAAGLGDPDDLTAMLLATGLWETLPSPDLKDCYVAPGWIKDAGTIYSDGNYDEDAFDRDEDRKAGGPLVCALY